MRLCQHPLVSRRSYGYSGFMEDHGLGSLSRLISDIRQLPISHATLHEKRLMMTLAAPQTDEDGEARKALVSPVIRGRVLSWFIRHPCCLRRARLNEISFAGLEILGSVDLRRLRHGGSYVLQSCTIYGTLHLEDSDLHSIEIQQSRIGAIDASGMTATGDIIISADSTVEGPVVLMDSKVTGSVAISDSRINCAGGDAFNGDWTQVGQDLIVERSAIIGLFSMNCAGIQREAYFEECSFVGNAEGALSLQGSTVGRDITISSCWQIEGEVNLLGSELGGSLAIFNNEVVANPSARKPFAALSLDNMRIGVDLDLGTNCQFTGQVRLVCAQVARNVNCSASTFLASEFDPNRTALTAYGCSVGGSLLLADGFRSDGIVDLSYLKVGGIANCDGGRFHFPGGTCLNLFRSKLENGLSLCNGFSARGGVSLKDSRIDGELLMINILYPGSMSLDLTNARIGVLWDEKRSWPGNGNLTLHGFRLENISAHAPQQPRDRAEWLNLQPSDSHSFEPYETLATWMRSQGNPKRADHLQIAKNRHPIRRKRMSLSERIWHFITALLIGYGYRPMKAAMWVAILVLAGGLVFSIGCGTEAPTSSWVMVPTKTAYIDEAGSTLPPHYPSLSPYVYALDLVLPAINLGCADSWHPDSSRSAEVRLGSSISFDVPGSILAAARISLTLLGWVLIAFFVAGLARLVRR